jgi:hypothetical protein
MGQVDSSQFSSNFKTVSKVLSIGTGTMVALQIQLLHAYVFLVIYKITLRVPVTVSSLLLRQMPSQA